MGGTKVHGAMWHVHIFKVCKIVQFCTNVGGTYPYKYVTHVFMFPQILLENNKFFCVFNKNTFIYHIFI